MRYKILSIIAVTLLTITGCASAGNAPAAKTPAEIEQAAQTARYDGELEDSSAYYRQLIDMHPTSFKSVLYQNERMQNALAQSSTSLLVEETLRTLLIFEKAQNEHFEDATPEAIAHEKEYLGQFIYNAADSYGQIIRTNANQLNVLACVFFINIYNSHFRNVTIPKDTAEDNDTDFTGNTSTNNNRTDSTDNTSEQTHDTSNTIANKRAQESVNGYRYQGDNINKLAAYYDQIFDLYERGIITDGNISPLAIIQNDILEHQKSDLDAAMDYARAFGDYQITESYDIKKIAADALEIATEQARKCRYKNRRRKDDDNTPVTQIPECEQALIHAAERRMKYSDVPKDNASSMLIIADVYTRHHHNDQALDLYWKVIEIYIKSDHESDHDSFVYWARDAARSILQTHKQNEQDEALNAAVQRLHSIVLASDNSPDNTKFALSVANKFMDYNFNVQALDLYWKAIENHQNSNPKSSGHTEDAIGAIDAILKLYRTKGQTDELNAAVQKIHQNARWSETPENDAYYMTKLARVFYNYGVYEQAADLCWKVIDGYQNSDHKSSFFARNAGSSAHQLLSHSRQKEQNAVIKKLNQGIHWSDHPENDADYIMALAKAYAEIRQDRQALDFYWKVIDGYQNSDHKSVDFARSAGSAAKSIPAIYRRNRLDKELNAAMQKLHQSAQWTNNPENDSEYITQIATALSNNNYKEQAVDLYWKVIDGYQNSEFDSERFANRTIDASSSILSIYLNEEQYDNLEAAHQRIIQNTRLYNHEAYGSVLRHRIGRYVNTLQQQRVPANHTRQNHYSRGFAIY